MIIRLRESFHSRTFKIIVWVILFSLFATSGIMSVFEYARTFFWGPKEWALQVNNQFVSIPHYRQAVQNSQEQIRFMRAQYGQYADLYFQMMGMKLDPQEMALTDVTRKALLNEVAQKLSLQVDPKLAWAQLHDPMAVQQELTDVVPLAAWDPAIGGINPQLALASLHASGVTTSDFEKMLMNAQARHDVRLLVEASSYSPLFEAQEKFLQDYAGHTFTIYEIPMQSITESVKKEPVSDEALSAYYKTKAAQENQYQVPEKRAVKILTFSPAHFGITISDHDVQTYYQNNKAQYIENPAQVQVRKIVLAVPDKSQEQAVASQAAQLRQELLKDPSSFEKKAKELSADASAAKGGLLEYFKKGTYERDFDKTAFLLKKPSDISEVIRTAAGYEILQLVGKKEQTIKPLAAVADQIKKLLQNKAFAQQFAKDIRAIISTPTTLYAFAKEKKATETTKELTLDESILAKTAFKLKKDEASFYQTPQEGVVVIVTDITPAYTPALEQLKARVKQDYYQEQAAREQERISKEAAHNPASYEKYPGRKVEKVGPISNKGESKSAETDKQKLTAKGVNLHQIFQLEKGQVASFMSPTGLIVVRLDEIAPLDVTLFEQKKEQILQELNQGNKSLAMAGFVASLYRNATINKNESHIRFQ